MINTITLLISSISVAYATQCQPSDTTYRGVNAALINQVAKYSISGTVEVIDGCSFTIKEFTFYPPALETYFYGSSSLETSDGFRIVQDQVAAVNGLDRNFTLSGLTSPQTHSWSEFRVLKMFSEVDNSLLAYAVLAGDYTPIKSSSSSNFVSVISASMLTSLMAILL